jgi:hypothetical protein
VIPFLKQNGRRSDLRTRAPTLSTLLATLLKAVPIFEQGTGGKKALETDQLPVTHDAVFLNLDNIHYVK